MKSLKSEKKISSDPQYFRLNNVFDYANGNKPGPCNLEFDPPIPYDGIVLMHVRLYCYSDSGHANSVRVSAVTDLRPVEFADMDVIQNRTGDASTEILIPSKNHHLTVKIVGGHVHYINVQVLGYMPIDYKEV